MNLSVVECAYLARSGSRPTTRGPWEVVQMPSFRAGRLRVIAYRGALATPESPEPRMINLHHLIIKLLPDRRPGWEQRRERESRQRTA